MPTPLGKVVLAVGIAAGPAVLSWIATTSSKEDFDVAKTARRISDNFKGHTADLGSSALQLAAARSVQDVANACHELLEIIDRLPKSVLKSDDFDKNYYLLDQAIQWQLSRIAHLGISRKSIEQATSKESAQIMIIQSIWVLGRCNDRVPETELARILETMANLCRIENPDLATLLLDFRPAKGFELQQALSQESYCRAFAGSASPEIIALYASFALGGNMKPRHHNSLLTDVTMWFPKT